MSTVNKRVVLTCVLLVAVLCLFCALVMQCNGLIESVEKPVIQTQNTVDTVMRDFGRPRRVSSKEQIPAHIAAKLQNAGLSSNDFAGVHSAPWIEKHQPKTKD